MSLLLTLAVLAIDPSAARTDVSAGVAGELRGGYAPVTLDEQSTAAVVLTLMPNVDLRHRHRRHGELSLGYSPRLFMRQPNRLSLNRPLFLHQIDFTYSRRLTRLWQLRTSIVGRIGEVDYTAVNLAFGPTQTAVPTNVSVLSFANVDGAVAFIGRVAPRTTLNIGMSAGTRRAIGTQTTTNGVAPFSDRVYGEVSVGPTFQITARDSVGVAGTVAVNDFDPGAVFGAVDARARWDRQLQRDLVLSVDGGVFVTQVVARQDDVNEGSGATFPVGGVALNGRLRSRARYTLDGGAAVGFSGFFDAISGRLLYRGRLSTGFVATFPPRWSAGIDASFVTSPTREPLDAMGGFPFPETLGSIQVPVRYFFDDNKNIEFGASFGVRGPHLAVRAPGSVRYEAWAYVAFRIGGGTSRGGREVTPR